MSTAPGGAGGAATAPGGAGRGTSAGAGATGGASSEQRSTAGAGGTTGGASSSTAGASGRTGGTSGGAASTAGASGTSGSAGASTTGSINVSSEQRTQLRQHFTHVNVQPLTSVTLDVRPGVIIPADVTALHTCPPDVVRILQGLPECRFVVVRDQIVIVEPRTRRIVTVIEQSG
jgi:hypothetical protein